jgi:proteic killer suppression protein
MDMDIEFEKDYLRELYENSKTTDKKHRYQPQVVNGYLKCINYNLFSDRHYKSL